MSPVIRMRSRGCSAWIAFKPGQHPRQPLVAARSRSAAFDAEAVALADDMQVRQMNDAPGAAVCRRVERRKVARLIHRRIGDPPRQGGHGQIRAQENNRVGQCRNHEPQRRSQVGDIASPARHRPREPHEKQRNPAQENPRGRGGGSAQPRAACNVKPGSQQKLREMSNALAADRIARLNGERIQRPEAPFCSAEYGPPAEPAQADDEQQAEEAARRPLYGDTIFFESAASHPVAISGASPSRTPGSTMRINQATASLGRLISARRLPAIAKQRAPLRAGRIILDIATARIDKRGHQTMHLRRQQGQDLFQNPPDPGVDPRMAHEASR